MLADFDHCVSFFGFPEQRSPLGHLSHQLAAALLRTPTRLPGNICACYMCVKRISSRLLVLVSSFFTLN